MFRELAFAHTLIRLSIICDLANVVKLTSRSILTYENTLLTKNKSSETPRNHPKSLFMDIQYTKSTSVGIGYQTRK